MRPKRTARGQRERNNWLTTWTKQHKAIICSLNKCIYYCCLRCLYIYSTDKMFEMFNGFSKCSDVFCLLSWNCFLSIQWRSVGSKTILNTTHFLYMNKNSIRNDLTEESKSGSVICYIISFWVKCLFKYMAHFYFILALILHFRQDKCIEDILFEKRESLSMSRIQDVVKLLHFYVNQW